MSVARQFLAECRSADAQNWLRLGLAAHGELPAGYCRPEGLSVRTIPETSLDLLASDAAAGTESFLVLSMTKTITRREWLTAAAARRRPDRRATSTSPMTPSTVSIVRAPAVRPEPVRHGAARFWRRTRVDVKGKRVVLKPNLVEFEPESTINTHPLLVHAAYEAFLAAGAASVRIAEGPGHRRNTMDMADAAGYFQTVPKFEDVFTDLNLDDVTRIHPKRQFSRLGKLYLPNTALGADLLVTHAQDEDASLDRARRFP